MNQAPLLSDKSFLIFLLKFLLTFCCLYYGTIAFIGLTAPSGYYWGFADKYLNYVAWLRSALLESSRGILNLLGYPTYLKDIFTIRVVNGGGVHVGYDCIGYGVLFFWAAFVFANSLPLRKYLQWSLLGLLIIFLINVIRIVLMVIAVNQKWKPLLGLDNHSWFNMAAYTVIFVLIYFFDVAQKQSVNRASAKP